MKKTTLILALVILSSCGYKTVDTHDLAVKELMNQQAYSVYAKFGQPQKTTRLDKKTTAISYFTKEYDSTLVDNMSRNYRLSEDGFDMAKDDLIRDGITYGQTIFNPQMREEVLYKTCETTFIIRDNTVIDAGYKGNGCEKLVRIKVK
jgi:hypothetical protein